MLRPDGVEEPCAMKIPRTGCAAELEEEVDILRRLEHPNIVAVKDAFRSTQEGQLVLVLVMPCANFDLASYLLSQRMCAEVVQDVAFQLAKAVHYVHEQRFSHRDIQPGNVLLSLGADSGSPCVDTGAIRVAMRVWLCDFGMARSVDRSSCAREVLCARTRCVDARGCDLAGEESAGAGAAGRDPTRRRRSQRRKDL